MSSQVEKNASLDMWHPLKKRINETVPQIFFSEGEVFNARLGVNVGFEQDGKGEEFLRPVLVISKLSKTTLLIVPLTTREHQHTYRYCIGEIRGKNNFAILSQIRVIDSRRLVYKMGSISKSVLLDMKDAIVKHVVRL
jgi:mRNA-degrading endonuclease toxin of MazEF toxin-antitoxin module